MSKSLVPHKLILVYSEEPQNKVAAALSKRIQKELQDVHLNAWTTDKLVESAQVPYTVIITNRTMSDGVVELQHFNPKIREEVHVSSLTDRLLAQTGAVMLRCTKT